MIPIVFVDETSGSWLFSMVSCRGRGALGKLLRCFDESLLGLAFPNLAIHSWHLRVVIRQFNGSV